VPTPGSEYPGPAKDQGDGERGLFDRSSPNSHKHGIIGKVATGAGAVALLGGAFYEWGKHSVVENNNSIIHHRYHLNNRRETTITDGNKHP
jgi:hypothetical protein